MQSRPSRLRRGQLQERRLERVLLDGAQPSLDFAVTANQRERGLGRNVEAGVHVPLVVADLRKGQSVPVDEVLERRLIAGPGNAIEVDLAGPLLACRFDRSGFTIADASSRRPEPERDRTTGDGRPVELSATDEGRSEPQRFRNSGVDRGRRRCCCADVRVVRSTSTQRSRHRDTQQQRAKQRAPSGQGRSSRLTRHSVIMSAESAM